MKKFFGILFYLVATVLLVLACSKNVGLFTEVEFQIVEQHNPEGYVNESIPTNITVIPEEQLPDYEYFYSYTISSGDGYFEDANGLVLPKGENIPLNPLSTSIQYKGASIGSHTIKVRAEDSFGFTEEIELQYIINEIPVIWTATSPVEQIPPGAVASITLTLESGADMLNTTYEYNYEIISGSGSLNMIGGSDVILDGFTSILPGVYQYSFIPDAMGIVVIVFNLRDSNGQEYIAEVKFEVIDIISVTSVNVTPQFVTIDQGSTQQLDVAFTPLDATNQGMTWESSNPAVATVDANGLVAAVSEGLAVITGTSVDNTSVSDTVEVTVSTNDIPVSGVSISPSSTTIVQGNTRQLDVAFTPSDATNQGMIWESSNPAVATVNGSGLVTAVSEGLAVITGTSVDNTSLSDTSQITVSAIDIPVTGINVTPSVVSILQGNTQQLEATFTPSDATNQGVIWTSSNPAIATVDANGLVTATSEGVVFIKGASLENNTLADTSEVTVAAPANEPPTANSFTTSVFTNSSDNIIDLSSQISDPEGDPLIVTIQAGSPANGAANFSGSTISYTPNIGFNGNDIIIYSVDDGNNPPVSGTITIMVNAVVNNPPSVNDFAVSVEENSLNNPIDVSSEINDPDSDPLTVTIQVGSPANGTASISGNIITYTPNNGFNGNDVIIYLVDDGVNLPVSGTISITVNALANNPPTAVAEANITSGTVPLTVNFTNGSSTDDGNIIQTNWDFGDGSPGNTGGFPHNVSHTFTIAGIYTVTLTVTDDGSPALTHTDTITITVFDNIPVTGINLSPTALSMTMGALEILTATIIPASATNTNVIWSSSNTAVATVDTNGNVTGVGNGTAVITAASEENPAISDTSNITVTSTSFNRNTGLYMAPAGSVVTVTITTEAYGKGSAYIRAHTSSNQSGTSPMMELNNTWNQSGPIEAEFLQDSDSFVMPANGQVYFYGRHNDIISISITEVEITNNQGPSQFATLSANNPIQ